MRAMERECSPVRRCAIVLVVLLGTKVASVAQAPAPLTEDTVDSLSPQGNRSVPTQKIMRLLKTRVGAEYNQDTINEDVRRLYDTKLFANVQVQFKRLDDNRVNVYFLVAEYPSVVQ